MKTLVLILLGLLASTSGYVYAVNHTGTITKININGNVAGRPACFRMTPELSGGSGWACLYTSNAFHQQIFSLLLTAYSGGKTCILGWDSSGADGHKIITIADCS